MSLCTQCQSTGRIRTFIRAGEYMHEREEYCTCAIGRQKLEESRKIEEDTGEFVPLTADPPGGEP